MTDPVLGFLAQKLSSSDAVFYDDSALEPAAQSQGLSCPLSAKFHLLNQSVFSECPACVDPAVAVLPLHLGGGGFSEGLALELLVFILTSACDGKQAVIISPSEGSRCSGKKCLPKLRSDRALFFF